MLSIVGMWMIIENFIKMIAYHFIIQNMHLNYINPSIRSVRNVVEQFESNILSRISNAEHEKQILHKTL